MIMKFNLNISEFLSIPESDRDFLVHKIFQSVIDGNHFFVIDIDILGWIKQERNLFEIYKRQIEYLEDIHNGVSKLLNNSKLKLNVELEGSLQKIDDQNWRIGYKKLTESKYWDCPAILVENIKTDGKLFQLIINQLEIQLKKKYGESVCLNFSLNHGGGNTTDDVFEYLVDETRLVVCICDTDTLVPDGNSVDTTFAKVKDREKLLREKCEYIGTVLGTPGREVENFLSLELIEKLFSDKDTKKCIEEIKKYKVN